MATLQDALIEKGIATENQRNKSEKKPSLRSENNIKNRQIIESNPDGKLQDGKLTPEQIQNWRRVLCISIGPYALIMPDEEVQLLKDKLQKDVNSWDKRYDRIEREKMKVTFGEKVRNLRIAKGLTQKELSDLSQITQATISRIESEDIAGLSNERLKRLAMALNVTVDFLVDKTDRLSPDDCVSLDPTAAYIFQCYEKLTETGKQNLKKYVTWLKYQEELEK